MKMNHRPFRTALSILSIAAGAAACASEPAAAQAIGDTGPASPTPGPTGDQGAANNGGKSAEPTGPAANPQSLPEMPYGGGRIIADPSIVTVTVEGDPMQADLESF